MTAVAGADPAAWLDGIGLFSHGTPLANDSGIDILRRTRDPSAAQKKLAEAGYRGDPIVVIAPTELAGIRALSLNGKLLPLPLIRIAPAGFRGGPPRPERGHSTRGRTGNKMPRFHGIGEVIRGGSDRGGLGGLAHQKRDRRFESGSLQRESGANSERCREAPTLQLGCN